MTTVLRSARLDRDISQEELASMLGLHQTAISLYELGRVKPRKPARRRLEAIFGVPADDLLQNDDGADARSADPVS